MSLLTLLSQAANAKTSSDAIDRLVSAWNLNPAKEIEDAIVAIDGERPAFVGDFLKAAKKAAPSERGPLLASVTTAALSDVARRLELLAEWSRDPRTSRMLLELLSGVPWSSDSSKPAWTAAFALMVKQADARFVAAAKELPSKWKVRSTMRQWLERAFARAIEQLEPITATALSTQERAALTKALAAHAKAKATRTGAKDEASLLQAIYATPADDGPRAVLADLLQERNDPRGEFIALQLANDARADKLLSANAKKWVGELSTVLTAETEFRRGFPAVGRTKFRHQADAEKFGGRPEWATFEELEWGTPTPIPRGQEPFCRFIGPAFRHLKIARGPHLPSLLSAKEPWALEALEVAVSDAKELAELGAKLPTLFPKLTRLFVRSVQAEWFRGVKHLDRLVELTTRGAPQSYGRGWEVLQSLPVGALVISTGESRWHFTRGSKGTFSKLTVHLADKENAVRHEDYARQLPTGFLESFELVTGKKPDAKAVAAIRRALELAQKRWASGKTTKTVAADAPIVTPLRRLMRTFVIRDLPTGERVVVDVEGPQVLAKGTTDVLHVQGKSTVGAAVSADGKWLALASWRELEVLSLPTLESVWKAKSGVEDTRGLQFQGSSLWHFARTGSERFDVKNGKLLEKFGPATRLVAISDDGKVALRRGKSTGFEVGPLQGRSGFAIDAQVAAFAADGQVLAVSGAKKAALVLRSIDPSTQQVTTSKAKITVDGSPLALALSPSGKSALVVVEPGFVIVDTTTLSASLTKRKLRGFASFAADSDLVAVNGGVIESLRM